MSRTGSALLYLCHIQANLTRDFQGTALSERQEPTPESNGLIDREVQCKTAWSMLVAFAVAMCVTAFRIVITPSEPPPAQTAVSRPYQTDTIATVAVLRFENLTGDTGSAGAVKDALSAFLPRQILEKPSYQPAIAHTLVRAHLWRGEVDKAMDELETIPGAYLRHAWYLERTPGFQESYDHPGFKAVVDAVQSQIVADRTRLEALGENLAPCVSNMRATTM